MFPQSTWLSFMYAGLPDPAQVFVWLEHAYQEGCDGLTYLNVEPVFDSLRSDPRFRGLLQRVGLLH